MLLLSPVEAILEFYVTFLGETINFYSFDRTSLEHVGEVGEEAPPNEGCHTCMPKI